MDWWAKLKISTVKWLSLTLYMTRCTASVNDPGTLYHLRTVLNRRNVVREAKKAYQPCNTFFDDVLSAFILACALEHFRSTSLDAQIFPSHISTEATEVKFEWLQKEVASMLDHILTSWVPNADQQIPSNTSVSAAVVSSACQLYQQANQGANPKSLPQLHHQMSATVSMTPQLHQQPGSSSVSTTLFHGQQRAILTLTSALHQQPITVSSTAQGDYRILQLTASSLESTPASLGRPPTPIQYLFAVPASSMSSSQSSGATRTLAMQHPEQVQPQAIPSTPTNLAITQPQQIAKSCRWCGKTFANNDLIKKHQFDVHGMLVEEDENYDNARTTEATASTLLRGTDTADQDHVFNYATTLLKMGLLKADFDDAIREMEGDRIFRCWKMMMLYFKQAGRHKYALEAFHLQAQQYATLSAQEAYRLRYNRGFNLKGGAGNNIPLDLMVEHVNNQIKDILSHQGANVTFESARKASASVKGISEILENLDNMLAVQPESGDQSAVNKAADISAVVDVLIRHSTFHYTTGRTHKAYRGQVNDTISFLDKDNLIQWISSQQKSLGALYPSLLPCAPN